MGLRVKETKITVCQNLGVVCSKWMCDGGIKLRYTV